MRADEPAQGGLLPETLLAMLSIAGLPALIVCVFVTVY